jgi:hypothetical protein
MKKAVEELLKRPENIGLSNISAGNTTMDGSVRIWSVGSGDR